jgi:hypothetical protein
MKKKHLFTTLLTLAGIGLGMNEALKDKGPTPAYSLVKRDLSKETKPSEERKLVESAQSLLKQSPLLTAEELKTTLKEQGEDLLGGDFIIVPKGKIIQESVEKAIRQKYVIAEGVFHGLPASDENLYLHNMKQDSQISSHGLDSSITLWTNGIYRDGDIYKKTDQSIAIYLPAIVTNTYRCKYALRTNLPDEVAPEVAQNFYKKVYDAGSIKSLAPHPGIAGFLSVVSERNAINQIPYPGRKIDSKQ